MAGARNHEYHILDPNIWPLIGASAAMALFGGAVMWLHDFPPGIYIMLTGVVGVLVTMFAWWTTVIAEAHRGDHTPVVQLHLRYGMILFIASEVMFFVAWFWAYFNASLFPTPATGGV
jgi:cytochrome c oxidase subunit 3